MQVRPRYEAHHMVTITPEAMVTAVELCAAHMSDKRFPEKAIDLLDQACSRARISQITQLDDLPAIEPVMSSRLKRLPQRWRETGIPVARLLAPIRAKLPHLAKRDTGASPG